MDLLLDQVTRQAMNYAIRSGITITSSYAISQCTRLMRQTKDGHDRAELSRLQRRLESKIRIISPAIDMIELIAARGHTTLESAVTLTKSLRLDIQSLGVRLASAVENEERLQNGGSTIKSRLDTDAQLKSINADIRALLDRIEDAVPLINLAITTSGANLSTNLPVSVSPSRLLQASAFLNSGDIQYLMKPSNAVQIGPAFNLSLYMLFLGHAILDQEESLRSTVWKEVIHKARVKLIRVPLPRVEAQPFVSTADDNESLGGRDIRAEARADEYAYQISMIEDLDDDRVHEEPGEPLDDVAMAGIREFVPIHQVSKIFYADTGKILNINGDSETNNPILLLKRDVNAAPPRRMMHEHDIDTPPETSPTQTTLTTGTANSFPSGLDPEWIALEVYTAEDHDSDTDDGATSPTPAAPSPSPNILTTAFSHLHLSPSPTPPKTSTNTTSTSTTLTIPRPPPTSQPLRTSLSLLEMLIRLTSLQQFQQASHLTISDELLNFFLEESSTTGAPTGDPDARKRIRMAARDRVGFDPYDESPIKRRGEAYQSHPRDTTPTTDFQPPPPPSSSSLGTSPSIPQNSTPLRQQHFPPPSSVSHSSPNPGINSPTARLSQAHRRSDTPSSQLLPGDRSALATPPGTTKSRDKFLREEARFERNSPS